MITDLVKAGLAILDKLIPDPIARQAAKVKLLELEQAGQFRALEAELAIATGQLDVNKLEAASPDRFVSGWRPAVGWVCVLGLGYQYLGQPLLAWVSGAAGFAAPPTLALGDLMVLLTGMLGLGGLRSIEKVKGVASQ
jgi:hypothetical protein